MTDNVTNFLASGIEIKGTIRFQNDMHIDGKIEGEIISDKGKVTIGETAQIKGDITAGDVRIYGNREEDPEVSSAVAWNSKALPDSGTVRTTS